jgi:hypothetical protein
MKLKNSNKTIKAKKHRKKKKIDPMVAFRLKS